MTDADLEFLKQLKEETWTRTQPSRGFEKGMAVEKRRLTDEEWARVQAIFKDDPTVLYEMTNACMGFGCGMHIGIMEPSTFPGVPNSVKWVGLITQEHLPLSVCELRVEGERGYEGYRDRTFFEDGWRAFFPYTHTPTNTQNLKDYGRPAPKSKGHYEY